MGYQHGSLIAKGWCGRPARALRPGASAGIGADFGVEIGTDSVSAVQLTRWTVVWVKTHGRGEEGTALAARGAGLHAIVTPQDTA